MPRYFFHRTNGFVDLDNQGTELADLHSARVQAVIFAGESLKDKPSYVLGENEFCVEVTDEHGTLLFTVATRSIEADPTLRRSGSTESAD